ncbi:Ribonuclease HII [Kingella potus]|uniref:Ribonuclease HII n=1 Tax=Kingella potus TaxID=265175 RepID=A0A377QYZ7_9NEIS|nr:ribonuclease HII [Kingella potus]UOP00955.1 ribonuclease HII [Kingella potus]STR00614.1 Ribonuclease HII [Kingella potus]
MEMILYAGVDEAGRGALVGSVFAAAVILPERYRLIGLTDSKRIQEPKRNELAAQIKEQAVAWSVASASVEEIARLNILHATMLAMRRAVEGLAVPPQKILIDGRHIPEGLNAPAEAIVGGDLKIAAISAASILAKTARDAEMYALAARYPQYGFDRHKGYSRTKHLAALQQYGALPEHRADFKPVRAVLEQKQQSE